MTMPLNRAAYEKLIEQDIAALPADMPALEREHIITVLRDSVRRIYEPEGCHDCGCTPCECERYESSGGGGNG